MPGSALGALVAVGLASIAVACGGSDGTAREKPSVKGTTTGKEMPTVHSDHGRILFSRDVEDVYVLNPGGGLKRLTNHPGNDFDPAWSPDGKRVVFRSERDGNNEIYVMNADGSDEQRLTYYRGDDWGPTWSPDGTKIAFNSSRDGPDLHLYVMNPDGSGVKRIGGDVWVEYPAWSPDGSRIAFMSQTWEQGDNYEIYVMNSDGSGVKRLTNAQGSDGHPAWSPDGAKIAFNSERESLQSELGHRIYVMNADGSEQARVTDVFGKYPDWSPDGRQIVFAGDRLYTTNADGRGLTAVPTGEVGSPVFPDWIG